MDGLFSNRVVDVQKSFIREILKVSLDPEIISFAGGLPNKELFPVTELKEASNSVLDVAGEEVLQYSNSEGYLPLREFIAQRYREQRGIEVSAEEVLITSGSQQALDLLGKIFLDVGDEVIMEEPGYLGAIQAFSVYSPSFKTVSLLNEGLDLDDLESVLDNNQAKLLYGVPNFQNPSGISYSDSNRKQVAQLIKDNNVYFIEDDPYYELRYEGEDLVSFKSLIPEQAILLGSFSKTIAPSFRVGWVIAPEVVMEKLVIAKQASDLHTNYISQRILYQYLLDNDLDEHIAKIKSNYNSHRREMLASIDKYFPKEVSCAESAGGMFLWITLPAHLKAMDLFELAIEKKVAFVPGDPFYINEEAVNTLRLNYSCVDKAEIKTGIKRLGAAMKEIIT
ncbi:aminotransferase-like domain-containing protein [Fuchsiella alkaliacetigena]|uniref:aminotransferase-like domain-containing protein n=1 Tax=Fuchsiella alkaliacetigena TaxID=957042 RepID=UPI00200A97A1|nr:PLP-dependent aminotransferase family protein [Fuchsiella alkaliacetigena]MCK8823806.1 PLP-dependent aminotransferase family protein [Fuchsiella alkaliacetigena]